MLHILTVHWNDDSWIDVQLDYLHKHIQQPYKVYAFLNNIPVEHRKKFFYSSIEPIKEHPVKLNILADIAAFNSDGDDDLLMFIDGDAIPISDVVSFAHEKLKQYPLAAVQRLENCGDIQPHPCFCLTTLKFWKAISGDWKNGFFWVNTHGMSVTDVGGNLLKTLREKGLDWYPMLRSNKRNIHPVLFGIYDDMVYHHGAAFRKPLTRLDVISISTARARLLKLMPSKKLKKIFTPKNILPEDVMSNNAANSRKIFEMIKEDHEFYKYFQQTV